ncbi:MAG TPA: winged helix-turn-helix domain-containing protein [Anaerolineae bacterium]|jgi:DNA-binding response OmpR family regulator
MNGCAIYLNNGHGPDPAIVKGLSGAGFEVHDTHTIADTINNLQNPVDTINASRMLLVAEVQSGAIPLLTLLYNNSHHLPPTLVLDYDGASIRPAIEALSLGVKDYVLATDPPFHRESRARVLAEQTIAQSIPPRSPSAPVAPAVNPETPAPATAPIVEPVSDFVWDDKANAIMAQGHFIRLSPVEAHMFGLLVNKLTQVVSADELIQGALHKHYDDISEGIKVLRPHMMRLRKKLDRNPVMAHRISTVRGNGYSFS